MIYLIQDDIINKYTSLTFRHKKTGELYECNYVRTDIPNDDQVVVASGELSDFEFIVQRYKKE